MKTKKLTYFALTLFFGTNLSSGKHKRSMHLFKTKGAGLSFHHLGFCTDINVFFHIAMLHKGSTDDIKGVPKNIMIVLVVLLRAIRANEHSSQSDNDISFSFPVGILTLKFHQPHFIGCNGGAKQSLQKLWVTLSIH
ncbi:hypothetical protein QQP08_005362 [Theobroma cacao]|nr:hypothetical protein QQP08_005362 [Theobroma cacao]